MEKSNTILDEVESAPPAYDEFFAVDYTSTVQHLKQTEEPISPIHTPTAPIDDDFILPRTKSTNKLPQSTTQQQEQPMQQGIKKPPNPTFLKIQSLLYTIFPMLQLEVSKFDGLTWFVFIITFPITIALSLIKYISITIRQHFIEKQYLSKQHQISNTTTKSIIQPRRSMKSTSIITHYDIERYDILYRALKKTAYNQYYSNYHNFLAQQYHNQLTTWENECQRIEKKNTSLFGRLVGREKLIPPPRPTPPDQPRNLHTFTPDEIQSLIHIPKQITTNYRSEPLMEIPIEQRKRMKTDKAFIHIIILFFVICALSPIIFSPIFPMILLILLIGILCIVVPLLVVFVLLCRFISSAGRI